MRANLDKGPGIVGTSIKENVRVRDRNRIRNRKRNRNRNKDKDRVDCKVKTVRG